MLQHYRLIHNLLFVHHCRSYSREKKRVSYSEKHIYRECYVVLSRFKWNLFRSVVCRKQLSRVFCKSHSPIVETLYCILDVVLTNK